MMLFYSRRFLYVEYEYTSRGYYTNFKCTLKFDFVKESIANVLCTRSSYAWTLEKKYIQCSPFLLFVTSYFFHFIHAVASNVFVYKMKMSTYIIDYDSTIICNDLYNIRRRNDHFHNERMMKAQALFSSTFTLYTAQLHLQLQLHSLVCGEFVCIFSTFAVHLYVRVCVCCVTIFVLMQVI